MACGGENFVQEGCIACGFLYQLTELELILQRMVF